ncbi:quinone oxidoreductase family protein [Cellulomonas endophytica]|uniref:quinone oxidoreductase family protein n=1 Tax=Cellulomonas endophytica TaxID=2494735 RepID=UPI001012E02B|nr:quinone oxidoreductase [Cellulomonas endophytica]
MHAVVATAAGGPEVLELRDLPDPVPAPDEVLVAVRAAGVNFIDTYRRSGLYPVPYPHVVGSEGAGEVVALGSDVAAAGEVAVGGRVAWAASDGSYATLQRVRAADLLPVPDGVDDRVAAALPLQGMTAHYLVRSTVPLEPGDEVLVHAAAGGVGLLLVQLAAAAGARVLATVGSVEKEALARAAGAHEVVRYRELDDHTTELPALVRDLTDGRGVRAVYDSVGRDTFDASLASLRPRGVLVLFGASSGPVPPVDPQRLNRAGSVFLTRPSLGAYTADRAELLGRAEELFALVAAGRLDVRIGATFPLAEAADAHRALEGRATTGKVLLLP